MVKKLSTDQGRSAMFPDIEQRTLASKADLSAARNDTGRVAYCGPYVVSAITGYSISKVEEQFHNLRGGKAGAPCKIKGTDNEEVSAALAHYGYYMHPVADFTRLPRKERPTVWTWMQKPRNVWAHYLLAIHKGKEGHWITIKGAKMSDTFTEGRWEFVVDGPHRGARIMEIFEVKRDHMAG